MDYRAFMPASSHPYHHGDLRHALITAALDVIEAEGPHALSLRGVARTVGVSHAAPYRHFADRDALLAAVGVQGFEALSGQMQASAPGPGWMASAAQAYVGFALAHPAHFQVMFSLGLSRQAHAALGQAGRTTLDQLVDSVAREQAVGNLRAGDPMTLALTAWSAVHGLACLLTGGALPAERFGDREEVARRVLPVVAAVLGTPDNTSRGSDDV